MKRNGFSIWQALLLLGGLSVIAFILYPVFLHSNNNSPGRSCQSNLKQIGLGLVQYSQDFDEHWPPAVNSKAGLSAPNNWVGALMPYVKSEMVFSCRQEAISASQNYTSSRLKTSSMCSYGYNAWLSGMSTSKQQNPQLVILNYEVIADPNGWTQTGTGPSNVTAATRHDGKANYLFTDGHVKTLAPDQVTALPLGQGKMTFVPR